MMLTLFRPIAITVVILGTSAVSAAPTIRELVPASAPPGARMLVTGTQLDDEAIAVRFKTQSGTAEATVIQRRSQSLEIIVPAATITGEVTILHDGAVIALLPFTLSAPPGYTHLGTLAGGPNTGDSIFKEPYSATVDPATGIVYVADTFNHRIRAVTPNGTATTLAGSSNSGSANGTGSAARFKEPHGIAWDPIAKVLYVADTGNNTIRKVTLGGVVTTLAGSTSSGSADGSGTSARFKEPYGIAVGADGNIYVADTANHMIRRITASGVVTTFAGTGSQGSTNGAVTSARFNEPEALTLVGDVVYVGDTGNHVIRKIENGMVSTVAGSAGNSGSTDGSLAAARFSEPAGIAADEMGGLIVADTENSLIRRIDLVAGTVSRLAGTTQDDHRDGAPLAARVKEPTGITIAGAVYVTDSKNFALRVLCPEVRITGFHTDGALNAGSDVRLFGAGFVPGATTILFDGVAATSVAWLSSTAIIATLPQTAAGTSISVSISTRCGGSAETAEFPIGGVENTPPVVTILNGEEPLANGSIFNGPVTPVITATDDTDPAPVITATLNGLPFASGTTITADGIYTLIAAATDAAGNRSERTIHFTIDTTPPVVVILESGAPLTPGSAFNRAVTIGFDIADLTATTVTATIDGQPYAPGQPFAVEGEHAISARVLDAAGNETVVGPVAFTIVTTAPALTFTSHASGQLVGTREITVTGTSGSSVSVRLNGIDAAIQSGIFTATISLLEGQNTLAATGTDVAGNVGTSTIEIHLDTRAPELSVTAVPACTREEVLELSGNVSDPHLDAVIVRAGDTTTSATVTAGSWSASIATGTEGQKTLFVEATDTLGHATTRQVSFTVDRTPPAIELVVGGAPFTSTILAQPITPSVRATDADPNVTLVTTLNGAPYTSGSEIAAEGDHTLRAVATDCAGNEGVREHTFTIDRTPPQFLTFNPPNGSKVLQTPAAITGTADTDATEVRVIETGASAPVTNGAFTLTNPAFADGANERTLELVDRAGHTTRTSYILGIRTSAPLIEITESGEPLHEGRVFARAVEPRIRVFDEGVTFTAQLNGAPFTSGTRIDNEGAHTLAVTANDSEYGQTAAVTRQFAIDRTPPVVQILAPADGATIDADHIDVRVSAGDATAVSVNGIAAAKSGTEWTATVRLDQGESSIIVMAHDVAGNSASAAITVHRGGTGPALIVTFPPDPYVTNRKSVDVTGRVLRSNATVTVNAQNVTVDPAGTFRLTGLALTEGQTAITVTATTPSALGPQPSALTLQVTADFTPPHVRLLADGEPLADGARFETAASISGEASDGGAPTELLLIIDGSPVASMPAAITASGGHTAVITARDAAGNEARLERTFYIGTAGAAGCGLEGFDPPDQAVVSADRVELVGRSGGAAGVKVNGVPAVMSAGSFRATVELSQEGPNTVTIACTDADGTPVASPTTITLHRATGNPGITITSPNEDHATFDETITVTGTTGPEVGLSVDVNGRPATISGTSWSVDGVRLQNGLNIIVATVRNTAGRSASASRRVLYLKDAPSLSITSPITGTVTGAPSIDVSGAWRGVDPTSIAVTGLAAGVQTVDWSDTTGRFVAPSVPLQSGDNTITVTGRDRLGRLASASVVARYAAATPVVTITSPPDNTYVDAETINVAGTFTAAPGSRVDINAIPSTVIEIAFSADLTFPSALGPQPSALSQLSALPVIARLTEPEGAGAFDTIRAYRLAAAPRVSETFPAEGALEVNPGVLVLVLFSSPMDRASLAGGFRLETASGTPVSGTLHLDHDVLTFAPGATLTPGERYTIRLTEGALDLAGQALTPFVSDFTVATTAPALPPLLTTASGPFCGNLLEVAGTTTPSARVRIDYGSVAITTTASPAGAFSYQVPLSGQQGFHIIRVRTLGADGTLSPAAELSIDVDCAGPSVTVATFNRSSNELTVTFSREISTPQPSAFTVRLTDGTIVPSVTLGPPPSSTSVRLIPAQDLRASTFNLTVDTTIQDLQGRPLAFTYTQLFSVTGDDDPQPGDGQALIAGEVFDSETGRPLPGATVDILNSQFTILNSSATDARGRYLARVDEGAHTIRASLAGYTTVTRQVIVAPGTAHTPIDIRLEKKP